MSWNWSDDRLPGAEMSVMEQALEAAMDAAADRDEPRKVAGRQLAARLRAISDAGPGQAEALTDTGVRVAYADIPPPMRVYWAPHPSEHGALVLLMWAWCKEGVMSESADHAAAILEAERRLEAIS